MDPITLSRLQQAVIRQTEEEAYAVERRMFSVGRDRLKGPWHWHDEDFPAHTLHNKPDINRPEIMALFSEHQEIHPEFYFGTRCGENYEDEYDVGHRDPCVCWKEKFITWYSHEWVFGIITLLHDVEDPEWPRRAFGAVEGQLARIPNYHYWMSQRKYSFIKEDEIIKTIKENRDVGWLWVEWIKGVKNKIWNMQRSAEASN